MYLKMASVVLAFALGIGTATPGLDNHSGKAPAGFCVICW